MHLLSLKIHSAVGVDSVILRHVLCLDAADSITQKAI